MPKNTVTSNTNLSCLSIFSNEQRKRPSPPPLDFSNSVVNNALLPKRPNKLIPSIAQLTPHKTDFFKKLPEKSYWWVPRECFLKSKLEQFTLPLRDLDFSMEPYNGTTDATDPERHTTWQQLRKLELFDECDVPDMTQGRLKNAEEIQRVLVCRLKSSGEVIAAIDFTINLDTRACEITLLAVLRNHKSHKIGSYLFHIALYISVLYGCDQIDLYSTDIARVFYDKHGFECVDEEDKGKSRDTALYLNLLNPSSCNKLLARVQSWNPTTDLGSLITMLGENVNRLDMQSPLPEDFTPEHEKDFPLAAFLASYFQRKAPEEFNIIEKKQLELMSLNRVCPPSLHLLTIEPAREAEVDEWINGCRT